MHRDETGMIVPAIVSEELWEKANRVLRRRSLDVKQRLNQCTHGNLLTGKLFCTHCGAPYYRKECRDRDGNDNSKWVCSGKINNGKDSCPSFPIYEREIIPILLDVFRDTSESAERLIAEYVEMYRSISSGTQAAAEIEAQNRRIETATRKRDKLLEYNVTGRITDDQFIAQSAECNEEIEQARQAIAELEAEQDSRGELRQRMEQLREILNNAERYARGGVITREFVNDFIERIMVTTDGDGRARLDIQISTGESTQKYLEKLRRRSRKLSDDDAENGGSSQKSRTGHTSKKMIQSYESSMK